MEQERNEERTPVFLSGDAYAKFVDDESKTLGALVESLGLRK